MTGAKGEKVNEFLTSVFMCDTRKWLNILIMNQILENILTIRKIYLGIGKAVSLRMSLVIYSSPSLREYLCMQVNFPVPTVHKLFNFKRIQTFTECQFKIMFR